MPEPPGSPSGPVGGRTERSRRRTGRRTCRRSSARGRPAASRHPQFLTRIQSRRRNKSCTSSPRRERWSAVRAFFIAVPPSPLGMAVFRAFTTIGAPDHGKEVALAGWVEDVRNLGGIAFLILRQRGGTFQATAKKKADEALFNRASKLVRESVVALRGTVQPNPHVRNRWERAATALDAPRPPGRPRPRSPRA